MGDAFTSVMMVDTTHTDARGVAHDAQEQQQEEALRSFYNAAGLNRRDDVSTNPVDWNFTLPREPSDETRYCSFTGVECADSIVTSLVFQEFGLQGSLPTELIHLTGLRRLGLGGNRLHGEFPRMILKEWTQLQHLELFRNDFHGPLPTVAPLLSHLDSIPWPIPWPLPPLKRILVQHNDFTGTIPDSFCLLSNLHTLDLSNNSNLSGVLPDCLGDMDSLHTVYIRNTKLKGPIPQGLCRKQPNEFGCDGVACPANTYAPRWGRQTADTRCEPCLTSQFLGATRCPLATEPPSSHPSSGPTSLMPSASPAPSALTPSPSPSAEPSPAARNHSTTPPARCNSINCTDHRTLSYSPTFTPSTHFLSTETPTSSSPSTWNPMSLANQSKSTIADRLQDPERQDTSWILLTIALFLSVGAMVTPLMARRIGWRRTYEKRWPLRKGFAVFVPEGAEDTDEGGDFASRHYRIHHHQLDVLQPQDDERAALDRHLETPPEVSTESESGSNDSESSSASSISWQLERPQLRGGGYEHAPEDDEEEIVFTWGGLYIPPLLLFAMDSADTGTFSSAHSGTSDSSSLSSSSSIITV
jgi:Leucine rich repeat